MSTEGLYRRIRRRETHDSRATPAIVVAVLAVLALAWLVTETVLAASGQRPLLLSPAAMVTGIAGLPSTAVALLITAAVVLVVVGLVLVVLALTAGRLGRHVIDGDRAVVVVHDEVIGSALVRTAADRSSTDPDRAVATVGIRRATVRITPTSGTPIDREAVAAAVDERARSFGLTPAVSSRVVIDRKGEVGA